MTQPSFDRPIIGWWSGGITSAVACKLAIDMWGLKSVRLVFIDTKNEDDDTYRFMRDCEKWYGKEIETITNSDFNNIQEVWLKSLSLNIAVGAKCSQMLKRVARERFEAKNNYSGQAFGFDINEIDRALGMKNNNPKSKPFFPLISELLTKKNCVRIINDANDIFLSIKLPRAYHLGYSNNNCFKTGCVQGGIGYWQKIRDEFPDKFEAMAAIEHELTDRKGQPVTMLKDQSKDGGLLFLKKHPAYPNIKDLSVKKRQDVKPLFDCNGFCGTNDLKRNDTETEINFES